MKYNILIFSTIVLFCFSCKQVEKKPNIIYIYTDQQHANMMSCAGNQWLETPAMDYIANNGIRFTKAYTTNPVCAPARTSMMTGRFPSELVDKNGINVRTNDGVAGITSVSDTIIKTTISHYLKEAGYHLIYGGKQHLPKAISVKTLGFTNLTKDREGGLATSASNYIKQDHKKPYFMVLSFINPHDICYKAIRDFASTKSDSMILKNGKRELKALDWALEKPENMSDEEFFSKYCPPIPPNLEPQIDEPKAIKGLINQRPFRVKARTHYTDIDWRMHRYAYARLTERVDVQIQEVLNALKESGQEENTIIMLSSDHGDHDGAHRLEHKSTFYEESTNVPFLMMWKNHIPKGQVDNTHLISNGLDFLPTVCDYANIKGVADPRGKSLKNLAQGKNDNWRKTLGVEGEIGRMVVHQDGYKYIKYDYVETEIQLLDLNEDPYETRHFTNSDKHQEILKILTTSFESEWFPAVK